MTDDRNPSTEHQNDGDAKHPSDTLDRDQDKQKTPKAPGPSQDTDTGIGAPDTAENGGQGGVENDRPDYS